MLGLEFRRFREFLSQFLSAVFHRLWPSTRANSAAPAIATSRESRSLVFRRAGFWDGRSRVGADCEWIYTYVVHVTPEGGAGLRFRFRRPSLSILGNSCHF